MTAQVLQLNPILIPEINDTLASRYTVHKLFEMAEPQAWLATNGASVDAVITGGHTGISRAMLEQLPRLKVVAVNGVGTDAVDLAYCRARSLPVTATLGALTEDVADLAIGLAIAALRQLPQADHHVRAGVQHRARELLLAFARIALVFPAPVHEGDHEVGMVARACGEGVDEVARLALSCRAVRGQRGGLLLQGLPNKLIARQLNLSVETVKDHVAAVLRALGVSSRTQAVLAVSQMTQGRGGSFAWRLPAR